MIHSIPNTLVVTYALFRMCEYFALKNDEALSAEGSHAGNKTALVIFSAVLIPARIGGWALLIWLAIKVGILATIGLVVLAFILSLLLQLTLGMLLMLLLGRFAGVIFLAAVPLTAILIALMIAAL